MMFTRVAPLRLKFSLIGSRTLVARTISSLMPFKALPNRVSLSPRLYTSAVSMKLIPLSRASFTMRVVSSWPRLPMFILPPNCIVPSATLLTMSPVLPSFLYFISRAPSATDEHCDRNCEFAQRTSGNPLDPGSGAQCLCARTGLRRSLQIPQATSTPFQHRPGQCTHVRISRIRSPQQLLGCLLLSELAPHHSAKKHVVGIHLCFLPPA